MGWTAADVAACGLWHFRAAVDGFGRANGWKPAGGGADLSEVELAAMGIEGF